MAAREDDRSRSSGAAEDRAVAELYSRVDAEIEPHQDLCRMRGICCDFPKSGHHLYVTELEARFARRRRSREERSVGDPELCPFWRRGVCEAREERPLGCRVYFCDPSWRDRGEEIYERYHAELRAIGERFGVEYEYSRWVEAVRSLDRPESDS